VNKPADEPRSLLRRLLKKADELGTPAEQLPAEPPSRETIPSNTPSESPIRPASPAESTPPQAPIAPRPRATQSAPVVPPGGVEERLQAEEALEKLRQKTALVATEFAEGKLNRAQFMAMYAHYNERRIIIEMLLARDPDTHAWQPVAQPGHTGFLREHYEARVLSYAIYDQRPQHIGNLISSQGAPLLDPELAKKILTAIGIVMRNHRNLTAQRKQFGDGQWAVFIPGQYTTSIVLFSLEPSTRQVTLVHDLHQDFERANRVTLERGIRHPDHLVFPHRALFDKPGSAPTMPLEHG
jgi:hypothetical protein